MIKHDILIWKGMQHWKEWKSISKYTITWLWDNSTISGISLTSFLRKHDFHGFSNVKKLSSTKGIYCETKWNDIFFYRGNGANQH